MTRTITLDTDHLEVLLYEGPKSTYLANRLAVEEADGCRITITVITIQEKVGGWLAEINRHSRLPARQVEYYARLQQITRYLAAWDVLPFDLAAADRYVKLRKTVGDKNPQDMRIAAIALCNDALVLTRNTRHYSSVPHLAVEDWYPYHLDP